MSQFYKQERDGDALTLHCGCGFIGDAIEEAIQIAQSSEGSPLVCFEFNQVIVNIRGDSSRELIYREWERAINRYIDRSIGPYPEETLSEEALASDAAIEAENARQRDETNRRYEAEAKEKTESLAARLATAPEFEASDSAFWTELKETNSQDPYSAATIRYAENWARLMQLELASGKSLDQFADATSHEANDDGITGAMYGFAVASLSKCWRYGEELRRWHNLKTQIRDEGEKANETGGVLNPAILCIGT